MKAAAMKAARLRVAERARSLRRKSIADRPTHSCDALSRVRLCEYGRTYTLLQHNDIERRLSSVSSSLGMTSAPSSACPARASM
jgi:hypothetical protein